MSRRRTRRDRLREPAEGRARLAVRLDGAAAAPRRRARPAAATAGARPARPARSRPSARRPTVRRRPIAPRPPRSPAATCASSSTPSVPGWVGPGSYEPRLGPPCARRSAPITRRRARPRDAERRRPPRPGCGRLARVARGGARGQDQRGHQRKPFRGVGEHLGIAVRQLAAQRGPDHVLERLDRVGGGLGAPRAGQLSGAGGQRLEHPFLLDPPQVGVVGRARAPPRRRSAGRRGPRRRPGSPPPRRAARPRPARATSPWLAPRSRGSSASTPALTTGLGRRRRGTPRSIEPLLPRYRVHAFSTGRVRSLVRDNERRCRPLATYDRRGPRARARSRRAAGRRARRGRRRPRSGARAGRDGRRRRTSVPVLGDGRLRGPRRRRRADA